MSEPTTRDDAPASAATSGGHSLRALRAERLLAIRDLARLAGVAPATINEIELGARPPGPRVIRRIADALGVDPRDVAEFRPRPQPQPAAVDADQVAARLEEMGYPPIVALRVARGTPPDTASLA